MWNECPTCWKNFINTEMYPIPLYETAHLNTILKKYNGSVVGYHIWLRDPHVLFETPRDLTHWIMRWS